jgi:cytochrome P450
MVSMDSRTDKCPVLNFDYAASKPEGTWWRTYDELRAQFPWYRNEFGPGFWTFVNHGGILEILQDPKTFSSSSVSPFDPDPPYKWIPEMLDGDEHKQWRRQLGPLFAPGAIARLDATVRQRAIEIVDRIAEKRSCDFMADFAQKFPTTIFLELMGLPVEELDQFLEWEHAILHTAHSQDGTGDSDSEQNQSVQLNAMMAVMGRFAAIIAERREQPRDDIVSKAIEYQIDGNPVSDADLLSFCLLMFMAGLDTVTMTLGWTFLHLARNPADRTRIANDHQVIPHAVEEFLRAYAIVIPARKVTADIEIQGCPLKAGDMVSLPLAAATRDDAAFANATAIDIDRFPNNHIAFGAGPHRCLGSHLARRELKIALEEWHKRIPDYELAPGAQMVEFGGQIGLDSLPLIW